MLTQFLPYFFFFDQFCRLRLSKNVSVRIFSIRFLNYDIFKFKCRGNPWSSAITRWINNPTFVLKWILKQLFIVKNIYLLFTFKICSVLGGFHGYHFKLLGDTIMIALVVTQVLFLWTVLKGGLGERKRERWRRAHLQAKLWRGSTLV